MKHRLTVLAAAALAMLLVSLSAATAADHAYMKVTGQKQGVLRGPVSGGRFAGMIPVVATEFLISSSRDAASGQPTGQVHYGPLTITKECDATTPRLFEAAVTNENLTYVVIQYAGTNPNGEEIITHTITLGQATIVAVTQYIGQPDDPRGVPGTLVEDISFTYRTITVDAGNTRGSGGTRNILIPGTPQGQDGTGGTTGTKVRLRKPTGVLSG